MNELWAEADTLIGKAMDGKSTYLLHRGAVDSNWHNTLFTGTEAWFYTAANHQYNDLTVLYPIRSPLPATYSQATYDSAVSGASFTYDSAGWALTGSAINTAASLKAHTTTYLGETYDVWDRGQPAPDKKWKFAVAEILIGDATPWQSGPTTYYKSEFPDTYNKFNCFKIHNLTQNEITFYFGTQAENHYAVTIPAWSQKCVRRDSLTTGYDATYRYFFKCNVGDPRFLCFDSHAGSTAQTMRANNITNASYLYNILEFVGQRDLKNESTRRHNRITFDPHQYNNIGTEYASAGYVPAITGTTPLGELVFHKGSLSYYRAETSSSTPEVGSISFDGFTNFATALTAAGLSSGTSSNRFTIGISTDKAIYYVWQKTTNLLTWQDTYRLLDLGSGASGAASIDSQFYYPEAPSGITFTEPQFIHHRQARNNGTGYQGHDKIVNNFWTGLDSNLGGYADLGATKDLILSTEGPVARYIEEWPIWTSSIGVYHGRFDGFNISHHYDVALNGSDAKLEVRQDWPIATNRDTQSILYGGYSSDVVREYRAGWPSLWFDTYWVWDGAAGLAGGARRHPSDPHPFSRMFEGPRKTRRYETATGNYPHNDINNDPHGANGADFTLSSVGTLTETGIAFQQNRVKPVVEPFTAGWTDIPNYPRLVIDDGAETLEGLKSTSSTGNQIATGNARHANKTSRVNLLKEHFNDLVNALKQANKIRPLCIDEVYFGEVRPAQQGTYLFGYLAPRECYAGLLVTSSRVALYNNLGVTLRTRTTFPDNIYADASTFDQGVIDNWRWVKISEVMDRAAVLGFQFRLDEMVTPLKYLDETVVQNGGPGGDNRYLFDTTATDSAAKWKFQTSKAIISGSTYVAGLGDAYYSIGNSFAGITKTSDSNRAILFHLYDTSRTETGARAKFAEHVIYYPTGVSAVSDNIRTLTNDANFVTATDARFNYIFYCQATPPVTHSA